MEEKNQIYSKVLDSLRHEMSKSVIFTVEWSPYKKTLVQLDLTKNQNDTDNWYEDLKRFTATAFAKKNPILMFDMEYREFMFYIPLTGDEVIINSRETCEAMMHLCIHKNISNSMYFRLKVT